MAGGRRNIGQYGGRNVSGARVWLEEGTTEDSMVGAMYKEQGCGRGGVGKTEDCMMDAMYQAPGCGWR